MAYARRVFGADPKTKQEIALDVGYSPNVARSVATHIENKLGFNNAMAQLAHESGNLAMQVMHEFKGRGFDDFTNSELTNALTAIGGAWSKFNEPLRQAEPSASSNKLRTIVLQQIENQTMMPEGTTKLHITEVTPEATQPQQPTSQPSDAPLA